MEIQILSGTVHNALEIPSVTALHITPLIGDSKDRFDTRARVSQEANTASGSYRPVSNRTIIEH